MRFAVKYCLTPSSYMSLAASAAMRARSPPKRSMLMASRVLARGVHRRRDGERANEPRQRAPDAPAAADRAEQGLVHDLLRDPELAREIALRQALEEVPLDDAALLVGQRLRDRFAHRIAKPLARDLPRVLRPETSLVR